MADMFKQLKDRAGGFASRLKRRGGGAGAASQSPTSGQAGQPGDPRTAGGPSGGINETDLKSRHDT